MNTGRQHHFALTIVAMSRWLRQTRQEVRFMEIRSIVAWVAVTLLVGASVGCGRGVPTDEQAAEYKALAEPIIKALETSYAKHGKYPATIEEIGMKHIETPYGSSRYEVHLNGQMCQLMIGNQKTEQDFNLHWTGMGKDAHKFPQTWTWVVYRK